MDFEISLNNAASKIAATAIAVAACALMIFALGSRFVAGMLTEGRFSVSRDALAATVEYFPDSARLRARLAEAEMAESNRDLARAEFHAARAANLSPYDYRFRLLLASIKEAQGDRAAAEESLRAARSLASDNTDVHWRLANLLLREKKLDQAIAEFRAAAASNFSLLPSTLDLVWRASGGNLDAVKAVTGDEPKASLALAQFLIKQSRLPEAATVFGGIERNARLSGSETGSFLNAMIAGGRSDLARALWLDLIDSDNARSESYAGMISNGGFEFDARKDLNQFDWNFDRSDYARLSLDTAIFHSGARSLRIDFLGRDTTRLDGEIKQLIITRPGAAYRLECFVKTEGLVTPEGPRVVVASGDSNWIAASDPIAQGSYGWQRVALDFVAPQIASPQITSTQITSQTASAVFISIKRKPRFSYDEPTRGVIWLDDFTLAELKGSK